MSAKEIAVMKKKVTTETGSIYIIDLTNKTWERIEMGVNSDPIRTNGGAILNNHPLKMEIGESLNIITDKITDKMRLISTSPVISIEDL